MTDRRLRDDGTSVLAADITATATTIPVSDAQWTTAAASYPLDLIVGGELVTATGVSTAGTQTFTGVERARNGVTKSHAAGAVVSVAHSLRLSLSHAVKAVTGPVAPTPPPAGLPDVPTDDLVLWIDAGHDPAGGNLAAGEPYTAELGSSSGADAQDPTVAVAAGVDVWNPDGVDDHIDSDYTPSFTPTTGALTIVYIGVWDAADQAATFPRLLSAESASSNGINITTGDAGDAELWTTVGGATTLAFQRLTTPGLVDGQRFIVAATLEAGALRIYTPTSGLSGAASVTGVGTITPSTIRVFRPTPDAITNRAASSPAQAVLVYEAGLTQDGLDEIAGAYGLVGGAASGQFRTQQSLAYPGSPPHVLTALGYTDTALITRAQLDGILNTWLASTGGTLRTYTNAATFATAIAAAEPGDLVRGTASFTVPSSSLSARGNRYGLAGSTMTTSPAGGTEGLPIIVTTADGVQITGSGLTNNVPVLDVVNTRHVWPVGFNAAGSSQFGIRCMNWGGSPGFPAYRAYNTMNGIRDAAIPAQGWFQPITSSGGTPPAGSGNEWGFSEHFVDEMNYSFDPNPGSVTGNPGEGHYYGRGAGPGWVSYCKDFWSRGNTVELYKANAIEAKPGCHRGRITDNIAVIGRGQNGAPGELCYLFSGVDDRPAWMNDLDGAGSGDIEIYYEGNRTYDYNISEVGATRNQCIIVGMAGVRVANNPVWAVRDSAGNFGTTSNIYGVLIQAEKDVADFGDASTIPTWIVNNLFWCRGVLNLGAADGAITGVVLRNNIVPTGYSNGTHSAGTGDFVAAPAVGALSTADAGIGPGSGFQLAEASALVGAGSSIADLDLAINADILDRPIVPAAPNPGPYQGP